MKRTKNSSATNAISDDMLAEYNFDYRKARPNRFAAKINKDRLLVLLDSDVAKVFTTPESVNTALRMLIAAVPSASRKTTRKIAQ